MWHLTSFDGIGSREESDSWALLKWQSLRGKRSSMTQSGTCNCITFTELNHERHYCKTPRCIRLGVTNGRALLLTEKLTIYVSLPLRHRITTWYCQDSCEACFSFWSPSCLQRQRQRRGPEDAYATRHDNEMKKTQIAKAEVRTLTAGASALLFWMWHKQNKQMTKKEERKKTLLQGSKG